VAREERDDHEHASVRVRRRSPRVLAIDEELDRGHRVEAAHPRRVARAGWCATERRSGGNARGRRITGVAELRLRIRVLTEDEARNPEDDAHEQCVFWASSGVFPALHLMSLAKP